MYSPSTKLSIKMLNRDLETCWVEPVGLPEVISDIIVVFIVVAAPAFQCEADLVGTVFVQGDVIKAFRDGGELGDIP